VLVLFLVAVVTFGLMHLVPGDVAQVMLGDSATIEQIQALRLSLGLDKPALVQFGTWLTDVIRGDLGKSVTRGIPVIDLIKEGARVTFFLAIYAEVIAIAVGVSSGVIAALRPGKLVDRVVTSLSACGIALPHFVIGIVLIQVLAVKFRLFPATGFVPVENGLLESLRSLTMPALALGSTQAALLARTMRAAMIEVMKSEYVTMARAKGLRGRRIVLTHAFPNAFGATLLTIGVGTGSLLSGSVVIEVLFALPGLGRVMVDALAASDIIVLQGVILVVTAIYVLVTLITDVTHAWLDPRLRQAH
jgi:peptide/nickel transport system permease protein